MPSIQLVLACFLICVGCAILASGEKVCPGYGFVRIPEKCESSCSPEKDECGNDKKCCFRVEQPCGHHCIVGKDNMKKSGLCPSNTSVKDNPIWGLCDGHMCDVDHDCQGETKCCPNICGSQVCIQPDFV